MPLFRDAQNLGWTLNSKSKCLLCILSWPVFVKGRQLFVNATKRQICRRLHCRQQVSYHNISISYQQHALSTAAYMLNRTTQWCRWWTWWRNWLCTNSLSMCGILSLSVLWWLNLLGTLDIKLISCTFVITVGMEYSLTYVFLYTVW